MSTREVGSGSRSRGEPDTIVAISSAVGGGLRGIVRLSGPRALAIASAVCARRPGAEPAGAGPAGLRAMPPRRPVEVSWHVPDAPADVPANLVWMPAPHTYTREEIVEIHTLGSPPLLRLLCDRLVSAGARPAGPGEFTRRAYLNGRLDLAQAESVMALIAAADRASLAGALAGLSGGLSRRCQALERDLVALRADVEASIDFADQDIEILPAAEAASRAERLAAAAVALRAGARAEAPWRPGPLVLFYGPPNAGKSRLFNALAGGPRAIVSAAPGTTRDLIEAEVEWAGVPLRLVDAAGAPPAAGAGEGPIAPPDAEGVERLRRLAREADLLLLVLDGSDRSSAAADRGVLEGRRGLVVLTQSDRGLALDPAGVAPAGDPARVACVSAATGEGIDRLRAAIVAESRSALVSGAGERWACSVRQGEALDRAVEALRRAADAARRDADLALAAAELRDALDALGALTGRGTTEDLLDAIFSRFCVGK
jgi:tRNA modification GTPase